ncbi:MAG: hypothetical protein Q9157_003315 [Trypethelium eluteriae]
MGENNKFVDLHARLRDLGPEVDNIRRCCRVSSISLGIVHQGRCLYTYNTGYSDRKRELQPDADTLYMLCSISKLFVVACVGILVDEGKLDWNRPVSEFLPSFKTVNNPNISKSATFVDILRHTAGLSNPVVSILGPHGKVLLHEKDFMEAVNDAPANTGDWTWEYSNIGYGIVAMVIQHVSGMRYSQFLKFRILEPLGMHNTAVKEEEVKGSSNVAFPYAQLENDEWEKLDYEWTSENNTPVLAAFGMRSSVNDLLIFCAATMAAEHAERKGTPPNLDILRNATSNPLRNMVGIRNGAYWTRPHDDNFQTTSQFHLGWMRAAIPSCQLTWGSWNELTLFDEDHTAFNYILGQDGHQSIGFLKHTGLGIGSSLSVNTFPSTSSAIVVLCNGLNVGDAADFAAQVYIQELFDLKPRQDIASLMSLETDRRRREFYDKIMREWLEHRRINDPRSPPEDYTGNYRGLGITISICHDEHRCSLYAKLNRDDVSLLLEFYSQDQYSYMPTTRNDWLRGGWLDWDYFSVGILEFTRDADGKIDGLNWQWEEGSQSSKFRKISDNPALRTGSAADITKSQATSDASQRNGQNSDAQQSHSKPKGDGFSGRGLLEGAENSNRENSGFPLPWGLPGS